MISYQVLLYLMTETNYIQTSLHFFKLASVAQGTSQVLQISSPCLKIAAQRKGEKHKLLEGINERSVAATFAVQGH